MTQNPPDSLAFLLADSARLFRRVFNSRARALGLTGQQWRVLVVLVRHAGLKQTDIADIMEIEPIALSRMVDRLVTMDMVERRADPQDRRARRLYLTDKAEPLLNDMRVIADQITAVASAGIGTADLLWMEKLLSRMRDNLSHYPIGQKGNDHG